LELERVNSPTQSLSRSQQNDLHPHPNSEIRLPFLCKDLISDDSPIAKEINFDLISENELREIIKNIEAAGMVKINHKILWRVGEEFAFSLHYH
jgi:hypothetical protein